MISHKNLLNNGRLGNQLFNYAFLRTTARQLGVKFYCPEWMGDSIFLLKDEGERAEESLGIDKSYREPDSYFGLNQDALRIEDGTEIVRGYFQTEKYFHDKEEIRKWYTFREEKIASVKEKYKHIDFSKSVGLHLRFGDKMTNPEYFLKYYIAPPKYYTYALSKVKHKENVSVFSDNINLSKKHLRDLQSNIIYMDENKDYEDLYLMSQCHDFVCSTSTLSWWGAWLNNYSDKTVVVPKEGPVRPDAPTKNDDFWPEGWIQIKALRGALDSYRIMSFRKKPFLKKIRWIGRQFKSMPKRYL